MIWTLLLPRFRAPIVWSGPRGPAPARRLDLCRSECPFFTRRRLGRGLAVIKPHGVLGSAKTATFPRASAEAADVGESAAPSGSAEQDPSRERIAIPPIQIPLATAGDAVGQTKPNSR